jgi:23S rRNA (pseudouridine1915-N3)-methyltransferase
MKICIISPGKAHDALLKDFIAEFEHRLSPYFTIEWHFPDAGEKSSEAKKILSLLKDGDRILLLDEGGKTIDTLQLANILEREMNASVKRLVFIIGGAYGVHESIKDMAHKTLSLSQLTFPHMLVRAILVEQLYRANSFLHGGKYHHE